MHTDGLQPEPCNLSRTRFSFGSHELIVEISCNNQVPFVFDPSYAKGDLDISYITSRIAGTFASVSCEDVFWFLPVW